MLYFFKDRISPCSPGRSGTRYVDQAGFAVRDILLNADIKYMGYHARQIIPICKKENT